jgi:hypothetical protein
MASQEDITPQLNALLYHLHIPEELTSPGELTPSLLLAILESLLRQRLALPDELRKSRSEASRIQLTKAFLGALSDDILHYDLQSVDPSRLAEGLYDETVFVGRILCSMGREAGLDLNVRSQPLEEQRGGILALSPDARSVEIAVIDLRHRHSEEPPYQAAHHPAYAHRSPLPPQPTFEGELPGPCIHSRNASLGSVNSLDDSSMEPVLGPPRTPPPRLRNDAATSPRSVTSIRYHGWIDVVHGDVEAFEASRLLSPQNSQRSSPHKAQPKVSSSPSEINLIEWF